MGRAEKRKLTSGGEGGLEREEESSDPFTAAFLQAEDQAGCYQKPCRAEVKAAHGNEPLQEND